MINDLASIGLATEKHFLKYMNKKAYVFIDFKSLMLQKQNAVIVVSIFFVLQFRYFTNINIVNKNILQRNKPDCSKDEK